MACTHHKRYNAPLQQCINQLRIEFDSFWIDRVIPTSKRNDSRPRNGEPIRLDTVLNEEVYIFLPEPVRVGGDIAVSSIQNLAWGTREVIPERLSTAVDVSRAFDLEARW
jgi:hypothetical protein